MHARAVHQSADLITQHHEKANWLSRNPDIRLFDTVYKGRNWAMGWQLGAKVRIPKGRFERNAASISETT